MESPAPKSTSKRKRRQGRPQRTDAIPAILGAAEALFAEIGYRNLSIEDIIQRSGVSRPTLYRHFNGKEDIAQSILLRFVDQARNAVFAELDTSRSVSELWERSARAYMEVMLDQGELLPQLVDIQNLTPNTKQIQQEYIQSYTERINGRLADLNGLTVPNDYLEAVLTGFDRAMVNICLKQLERGEPLDAAAYVAEAKTFILSFGAALLAETLQP